jgi:glycosyltransferase involved in cell wall biosynthesis
LKVLLATDTVGGVLTYTAGLGRALEARGHEIVVATMGPRLRSEEQRTALPGRVHESDFRLEWMEDPWEDVAAAGQWLRELEEEERPDVVHLCSFAHGAVDFAAPKILVAHSCVLSWWRAVHGSEAPPEWDRYREEMAAGLRGADAVVAPTGAMLRELERDHELAPGRATVIHNAVAPPPLLPTGLKQSHIDRNRPVDRGDGGFVLGSGRFWDAAKNLAALDAAAAGLEWPVVVAGDLGAGPAPRHAECVGALAPAELAALRRRALIYAAPALYEPFGLGILEAAGDGCALVLGDIPSLRELWSGAALFVDPRDHLALHEALAALIASPERRAELAAAARMRAGDYSIDLFSQGYERLYMKLTATRAEVPL